MEGEATSEDKTPLLDALKGRQIQAEIDAKVEELKLQAEKQTFDIAQAKAKVEHDVTAENLARQDRLNEQEKTRKKERTDRILTIIPVIIALIVPTFGFIQFIETQAATEKATKHSEEVAATAKHETAILEARKNFITRRFDEYSALIKVTGIFITEDKNSVAFKNAQKEFDVLYWSRLPLVEDEDVEVACVDFREALDEYTKRGGPAGVKDKKANIRDGVLRISKAVRPSLIAVYNPLSNMTIAPSAPVSQGTRDKK